MKLFEVIGTLIADGIDPNLHSDEIWKKFGRRYSVLIIDSSGFTRITEEYGSLHFLTQLVRVRELALPILKQHCPLFYRFEADNIYAYFDEVNQAVATVININNAIEMAGITLANDEPYKICAGVGYGDMLFSDVLEGCFGHEMNLTSKLGEDVADPDQMLMTAAAYDACSLNMKKAIKAREIDVSGVMVAYYQLDMNAVLSDKL